MGQDFPSNVALSEHAVTSTAVIKGTSVKRRLPPL